jgi:hypothetical protein
MVSHDRAREHAVQPACLDPFIRWRLPVIALAFPLLFTKHSRALLAIATAGLASLIPAGNGTELARRANDDRGRRRRPRGGLHLGNAGGAKDPDFWCAFEDGEVRVIGDEPGNT